MLRKFGLTVLILVFLLVAANVNLLAQESIKIGVIGPLTGTFAGLGNDNVDGVKMALEEVDYKVAGRKIELYSEDTGGQSAQLLTKLDALESRDEVDVILGPVLGNEGMATVDWSKDTDMPIIMTYSAPEDITMRQSQDNIVRAGWTGAQVMFDFGEYAARELDYESMVIIGQDYSFPHNQAGGFIKGFYIGGGKRVERIWHPQGTNDFSSIFARLPEDVDAALYISGGEDSIHFVNQWHDFGLDQKMPLLASSNVVEPTVLPEIGDDALGILSAMHFASGSKREEFIEWSNRYKKMYNKAPSAASEHGYVAAKMALEATREVDGNIENRPEFMEALKDTNMPDAPRGPFHLDQYGNPVQNVYLKEVKKIDGELVNVPIRTFKDVSQFGPFADDPELYMSLDPDSANFPPATREEFMKLVPKRYFD